jgi:hypothetical protein
MLTKIRGLIDTADSLRETNPEAAGNYQAKAEELMVKYRVEEEALLATDPTSVSPIWGDILVASERSPYVMNYLHLFHYIGQHTGIRVRFAWAYGSDGKELRAYTVGYEADLRYAEVLYTSARMVFNQKLEPVVNRSLPEEDNIYRLRAAGIERVRIADMIWGMGSRNDKKLLSKVGRVYAAECKRRGEEPMVAGRGVNGAAYRAQFAEQFVATLSMRLRQARDAAGRQGGGLVLHGRSERVQEAYYERFPQERPKPAVEAATSTEVAEKCKACEKSKRGACKEHYIPTGRSSSGPDMYSAAAVRGRQAGAAAARHVDLGRGGDNSIGGA